MSLGVAAIGVAAIHSVQGQSTDPARSWSVSASLRGFYDDNVNTSSTDQVRSYGVEVSPTLAYNLALEQTTLAASYTYAYKWYEKAINRGSDHDNQTHTLAARLTHTFSERLLMSVQDSFVIGQEPDVLRIGNNGYDSFQSFSGDNIRNYGSIAFNAQVSRQFGIEVGYANALYDYADNSDFGNSAYLDRLEHSVHIDGRWNFQRDTVGIIGYQYSFVCYTADEYLATIPPTLTTPAINVYSDSRNSRTHYGYVGLEHTFLPDLTGSIRAGVSYSDYFNSPDSDTTLAPYFKGNLTYSYAQESHLEVGVSHDRTATDQFSIQGTSITHDSESTVAYLALTHRIIPKLFGSVIGTYQYSTLNGGQFDQESDSYYVFGANLEYRINRHVSANVGYNYDRLDSNSKTGRGDYDRNRVYVGATFVY